MRLHQVTAGRPQRAAALRIAQQAHHGVGKGVGVVGDRQMMARFEGETFCADGGRHDRLAHGERFKNLDARAAAGTQRHNVERPFANEWPDVVDGACDGDTGARGQVAEPRAWIAADNRERDVGHRGPDARQNGIREVRDGVLIGMPVHRAAEDQMMRALVMAVRDEVVGVDARRHRRGANARRNLRQAPPIVFRDRDRQIRAAACICLAGAQLAPLDLEQCPSPRT